MIDTFYDENGQLVTREISCEERVQQLRRANAIHIDDMYKAIDLLKRVKWVADMDYLAGWIEERDEFLNLLSGPMR